MRKLYSSRGIKPRTITLPTMSTFVQLVLMLSSANILLAQDAPPTAPFGVIIPFSTGEIHAKADIEKAFGAFPKEFTSTTQKKGAANWNKNFKAAVDYTIDDDPTPEFTVYKAAVPSLSYGLNGHWTCTTTPVDKQKFKAFDAKNKNGTGTDVTIDAFVPPGFCGANSAKWNAVKLDMKDSSSVPRWLAPGKSIFEKRTLFLDRKEKKTFDPTFGYEYTIDMGSLVYKPCKSTCDKGRVVKVTMNDGSYSAMLHFQEDARNTCQSFKICFNPKDFGDNKKVPTCEDTGQIHVGLASGVVIWANNELSSVIKLLPSRKSSNAIEFGFGVHDGGVNKPEFYIGNMYRERVTSDAGGYSKTVTRNIAFFFPSDGCLMPHVGIYSENMYSGFTLVKSDEQVEEGPKDNGKAGENLENGEIVVESSSTVPPPVIPLTTTPSPQIPHFQAALVMGDTKKNPSVYQEGKWWTWSVYVGFVIGTIVTDVVGGFLLFLIRRTMYGFWYRGMFKRYGCDASGTTGGVTGAGFGTSTIGAVTVGGGGTTGGGTTASSTSSVMSTGGTSTGTLAL